MNFVQLITVKGVSSFSFLVETIQSYYPHARFQFGDDASSVLIAVPDLYWFQAPDGEEGFFGSLVNDGLITSFSHQAYSDQEVY